MTVAVSETAIATQALTVLADAEVVSPGLGVDVAVELTVRRGRHWVIGVVGAGGRKFVVKLPPSDSPAHADGLRAEIDFYESVASRPSLIELGAIMPAAVLLRHDPPALVLERVAACTRVGSAPPGSPPVPAVVVEHLGRALALIHSHTVGTRPEQAGTLVTPWPTSVDRLHPYRARASRCHSDARRDRRLPGSPRSARRLGGRRDAEVTLVHGDIKGDNLLIRPDSTVVIVDWSISHGGPARRLGGRVPRLAPPVPHRRRPEGPRHTRIAPGPRRPGTRPAAGAGPHAVGGLLGWAGRAAPWNHTAHRDVGHGHRHHATSPRSSRATCRRHRGRAGPAGRLPHGRATGRGGSRPVRALSGASGHRKSPRRQPPAPRPA